MKSLTLGILILVFFIVYAFIGYVLKKQWTGLPTYGKGDTQERYVTFWGWLSLLIVPLLISAHSSKPRILAA
jgi:hypothetical protein